MTPLRLITVLPLSAGAISILKLRSRAVAVCLNMSLFTQGSTSPTRTFIGVGPNFILSMMTLCVLGAAATAPGAPNVMTAAIAVDAEIAIERNPDLAINVRSAHDVRHASGVPGIRLGRFQTAISFRVCARPD